MSRRFGRNQKRKMREQIAFAVNALEEARQGRKRMKEAYDEVYQELDDAKRIAGSMSVLFQPKAMKMRGSVREYVEVVSQHHPLSLDSMDTIKEIRSMRLPVLLSTIDEDRLHERVHIRVQYDGAAFGYCVTQATMQHVPNDILLRRVGQEIAQQLISAVKGVRS